MTDDLIAFLTARLGEDEARAKDHLCIHCGVPVVPLRNALGVTGYTHDGRNPVWQGQRCPGGVTGAEPVQDPARTLREAEADRMLIRALMDGDGNSRGPEFYAGLELAARFRAYAWSDHADYRAEWRP